MVNSVTMCVEKQSKGRLTRHINAKHEKNVNDTGQIDENDFIVDDYCKLVNESAKSLSEDECYPESIRKQFETCIQYEWEFSC